MISTVDALHRREAFRVLASQEVIEFLRLLGPKDKRRRWADEMMDTLKGNMYCGNKVPKDRIPLPLRKKHEINHLYRYPLPEGYRGLYTILDDEFNNRKGLSVVILEIADHNKYSELLGYEST